MSTVVVAGVRARGLPVRGSSVTFVALEGNVVFFEIMRHRSGSPWKRGVRDVLAAFKSSFARHFARVASSQTCRVPRRPGDPSRFEVREVAG